MEEMRLAESIREVIKAKGLKQGYVADKAGFSANDFSNMLNGRKIIRAEYLPLIAKAVGVDLNTLMGIGKEA